MIKKLILAASIMTAACAPHPEVRIQQVYCITPAQYKKLVDAEPGFIKSRLTGNAQKDFKLSAEQNVLLRAYADGLLEVIGGCMPASP